MSAFIPVQNAFRSRNTKRAQNVAGSVVAGIVKWGNVAVFVGILLD